MKSFLAVIGALNLAWAVMIILTHLTDPFVAGSPALQYVFIQGLAAVLSFMGWLAVKIHPSNRGSK